MKRNRLIASIILAISLLLPLASYAQTSGETTASQVLNTSTYTFTSPDDITFSNTFVAPGRTESVQKIYTPETSGEIVEFVDLRNSGNFLVRAYMTQLTTGQASIDYENVAIATRSGDSEYSVDMDDENFIALEDETVVAALDYAGNLVDGEIPDENFTNFSYSSGATSDPITIINGTTIPDDENGRLGSYSVAPAIKVDIPADTYGEFTATLTFELVL